MCDEEGIERRKSFYRRAVLIHSKTCITFFFLLILFLCRLATVIQCFKTKHAARKYGIAEENACNIFVNRMANFTLLQMREWRWGGVGVVL